MQKGFFGVCFFGFFWWFCFFCFCVFVLVFCKRPKMAIFCTFRVFFFLLCSPEGSVFKILFSSYSVSFLVSFCLPFQNSMFSFAFCPLTFFRKHYYLGLFYFYFSCLCLSYCLLVSLQQTFLTSPFKTQVAFIFACFFFCCFCFHGVCFCLFVSILVLFLVVFLFCFFFNVFVLILVLLSFYERKHGFPCNSGVVWS